MLASPLRVFFPYINTHNFKVPSCERVTTEHTASVKVKAQKLEFSGIFLNFCLNRNDGFLHIERKK